jgi:hypothetical protein
MNAPNIILGIAHPLDPDNTNNQVILILKKSIIYINIDVWVINPV